MSDAVRLGRPALLEAIERALDGMNEKVAADFRRQDDEWRQKYDKLQDESQETQRRMEIEISQLKEQVESLKASLGRSDAAKVSRPVDASDSRKNEQTGDSKADNNGDSQEYEYSHEYSQENLTGLVDELQRDLEKSHRRNHVMQAQLDTVVAQARKRKEEVQGWIAYGESLERQVKLLEKRKKDSRSLSPTLLDSVERVPKPTLSASFSSSTATSFLGNQTTIEDSEEELDIDFEPRLPELPLQKEASQNGDDDNDPANDEVVPESTQGDPSSDAPQPDLPSSGEANSDENVGGRVTIKSEPSSDGPEIVWERVTKKPRSDNQSSDGPKKTQPQTPRFLPSVKRENSDNTQRALGLAYYKESQESIDLDEGQLTVQTPRKRHLSFKKRQQMLIERESDESSEGLSQGQQDDEPQPKAAIAAPQRRSALQNATPTTPLAPISSNIRRGLREQETDKAKGMKSLKRGIESLTEDNRPYSSPNGTSKRTAMEPPSTTRSTRLSSLLNSRPSDPSPVATLPRPTPSSVSRYHGSTDSPIAGLFGRPPPTRRLPHLRDEDGTSSPKTPTASAARHAITPATAVRNVGTPATAVRKRGTPATARNVSTPAAAVLSTPTTNPLTAALLAAKAESAAKKAASSSSASPLRKRPVERLKMDDFKINPAFNNGETFAYNVVVRGRTDRAGLSGCTDPQCCGKAFRGMATSELDAAGPGHIRRSESVVLMERHLGDSAYTLAQMSPEEKRELWLEARTKELADKYGKHRHRYHRRASPPGFWDTDFPTTQDEEHNRAEAEKVERITVQERYREAMRSGGGRWLFRDE